MKAQGPAGFGKYLALVLATGHARRPRNACVNFALMKNQRLTRLTRLVAAALLSCTGAHQA